MASVVKGWIVDYLNSPMHVPAVSLSSVETSTFFFLGQGLLDVHLTLNLLLQHADEGCMAVVKFACPDIADPQPKHCPGFAWPASARFVPIRDFHMSV
jgi:hypothetical protein